MSGRSCEYCFSEIADGARCPQCADFSSAAHHLPAGTTLAGRYRIGKVIGEGGFGITYTGYDTRLGVRVAVKEYFPRGLAQRSASSPKLRFDGAGDERRFEDRRTRFLGEARIAAKMGGSIIVGARDLLEENGTSYIVMEYVDGITLKALTEQNCGRMPADELFPIIEPLFSALSELHAHGLIHRDITPDNIMVSDKGVRLLDFGCAKESSEWDKTATAAVTRDFTSIEQYRSRGQGPWTDIYSLAATLYFCLVGKPPISALDRLAGDKLPAPSEMGADIDPKREKALMKALNVKPRQRYKDIREMHAELYKSEDRGDNITKRKSKRLARCFIAAAVLCVFAAAAVIMLISRPAVTYTDESFFGYFAADDGVIINSYSGTDLEIYVPPVIAGKKVIEYDALGFDRKRFYDLLKDDIETGGFRNYGGIGMYGFFDDDIHRSVEKVVLPAGIREIGDFAFTECLNLKTVIIPEGAERLGIMSFSLCKSLEELKLPDSIKEIGEFAFIYSEIRGSLDLPASLTEIKPMTFRYASIGSLSIPDGLTVIGEYAFDGCYFVAENADYTLTIPDSVTEIRKGAFRGCTSLYYVDLPQHLKEISGEVFEGCDWLSAVSLPDSIEVIGENAFAGCASLRRITIPDAVKEIRSGAFKGCANLSIVSVPSGCNIADDAFEGCPAYIEYR